MKKLLAVLLSASCMITSIAGNVSSLSNYAVAQTTSVTYATVDNVPAYSDDPYVEINGNQPEFEKSELTTVAFENYSELDYLGRCGVAYANVCTDIMPTEERGEIGSITPTGWHSVKYDCVDGKYLYNRCHLIGYQLAGENANEKNLITGTRYLNIDGMLPFENLVDDYVEETDNHVLYRVTPDFEGENLVADGVQMEAYSVEDNGAGVCYNVYCYNVQPGVSINYATGASTLSASTTASSVKGDISGNGKLDLYDAIEISKYIMGMRTMTSAEQSTADYNSDGAVNLYDAIAIAKYIMNQLPKVTTAPKVTTTVKTTTTTVKTTVRTGLVTVNPSNAKYILNTKTKKFHIPTCSSAKSISAANKAGANDRAAIIAAGYSACKRCDP